MRHPIFILLILLLSSVIIGCKSEVNQPLSPEADTRLWVKKIYDEFDPVVIPTSINKRRAAAFKAQFDKTPEGMDKINLGLGYGMELLNGGQPKEAIEVLTSIYTYIQENKIQLDAQTIRNQYSLLGIAYMRLGETENCLANHNHASCFIPVKGDGIHTLPTGSRNAITIYENSLKQFPDDLETRYLLNIAYMTLGEYPDKVPQEYLIDPSWFKNDIEFPVFKDVAPQIGLNRLSMLGGTIVDDFTNDGWLDIIVTSWGPEEELVFYKNNGDGTFSDQTEAYNLKGHVAIINVNQTDFNNDGWLDIYLMRGGWFRNSGDIPNTLLKNTGDGFVDVTLKSGLMHIAPTQTSAWADFNLDGWLDVVVANESLPDHLRGIDLYINQQDGTFVHTSAEYGLTLNQYFKGCVATDVNNDRYPDIYFSALDYPNSLFINQGTSGSKKFLQAASEINIGLPLQSFPCWSFDFDNNGFEDIFVTSYSSDVSNAEHWMLSHLGKADQALFPKLYRNSGNMQFEEVGVQMGLTEIVDAMGCNFGDINSDGFLDFYLATGNPLYQSIVPNKMYLNMEGKRFEDVSYVGGFANIQKGHGVGFGDLDHDGDEDIYVKIGGAYEGDGFYNCLFENPNHEKNNWVALKLTGTSANKAAIGARVAISISENGQERMIYRTVTSGASFGGNSLILEVGLRKASVINKVTVQWPCKECNEDVFTNMDINKAYLLAQGKSSPKELKYNAVKFADNNKHEGHHH
jgi:hypothetical protein